MKKRLLLFLCIFTLLLSTAAQAEDVTAVDTSVPAPSAEKADTLSPFARTRSYDGRFTDVDASAWYHDAVAALYEYGLTEGVSGSAYAPEGSVTIADERLLALGTHKYFLSADEACKEEFLDCNVQPKNITTSGFLTLTCDTEPAADLTVNLIRLELSGNGAIQ